MFGDAFRRFKLADRTLPNLIVDAAGRFGDAEFLTFVDSGRDTLRFDEVPPLVARAAGALAGMGVERDDVVAIMLENCLELVVTSWAQAWLGGMAATLHPTLRGELLEFVLGHCEAKVLVTSAEALEDVWCLAPALPALRTVVVVGELDGAPGQRAGVEVIQWDALVARGDERAPADVRYSDPVMLMYTSGTTGRSKGVVLPHHQLYCWAVPLVDRLGWGPSDHLYTPLPLYHIGAQTSNLLTALVAGARTTFSRRFSASSFWREVVDCGATHALVLGVAEILMKQPPSPLEREHRLDTLWCAPPPADPAGMERRFGVDLIWQGYGMTEAYPCAPVRKQADKARTCVGRPTELFDLKVVDEDDIEVPWDGSTVGEIVLRPRVPAAMTSGYYRDPEATVAASRNFWFHTGDLATRDAEGYLFLWGRKKDAIRRRGENVSAFELEHVALTHPAVAQAAAFGVPSELGEEDVKLDVVLRPGHEADPAEVIAFLESRVPRHMVPRYLQIRDSFPTTPSERVEKYRLREEGSANATFDRGANPSKVQH